MNTREFSICTKCEHFHNREPSSARAHIWYNHICLASPLPTRIDPYDGKAKPYGVNDLGGGYPSEIGFEFCRDINPDGACGKFSALAKACYDPA